MAVLGRGSCDSLRLGRVLLEFGDESFQMTFWGADAPTASGSRSISGFTQAADGTVSLSEGGQLGTGQLRGDTLTVNVRSALTCYEWKLVALARPKA